MYAHTSYNKTIRLIMRNNNYFLTLMGQVFKYCEISPQILHFPRFAAKLLNIDVVFRINFYFSERIYIFCERFPPAINF